MDISIDYLSDILSLLSKERIVMINKCRVPEDQEVVEILVKSVSIHKECRIKFR